MVKATLTSAHPWRLKVVVILLIAACLALAVHGLMRMADGRYLPAALSVGLWLPLAFGLWILHPLARRVAVTVLWLVVIFLPLGVINPFAAMDGAIDVQQSVLRLAAPVAGAIAAALYALHQLGKHRSAFGRNI